MNTIVFSLLIWLFSALPIERCGQCGMDLSKFSRTRYEISWMDNTVTKTCGVQCGLTQQILHREKFKSSMARDYFTGRVFDAGTGFYVFGSNVVPDMAPGFIAFQSRTDAEKFQKESGGRILTFREALSIWAERKARR
jgi:nitrous oxide reductase accessory protein NosL